MDQEATERELRRLFRRAGAAPLPDPDMSDEQLAEIVREHAKNLDVEGNDDSQESSSSG